MRTNWYWTALGALIVVSLAGAPSSCPSTPFINQPIVPDAVAPGGPAFTITVNGDQFTSGSTIDWNGTPLTPVVAANPVSTQLQATVPASLIAKPGTAVINVLSGSGGGTSNVIYFPVWNPATTASFVGASGSPIMVGVNPAAAVVADFNGDGKPDLAVANTKDGTVTILLGNGDGTFTPAPSSPITVGAGPDALAVGDFNLDGVPDLAVADGKAGTVTILLGKGNGTFAATAASPITVGTGPDALAVADFNGDGDPDLVVANSGSSNIMYLQGNGDGTFKAPASTGVGTGPSALAVGDFNGSGYLSLAVANAGSNNVTILIGSGSGTFAAPTGSPITVGTAPSSVAVADVNGDGFLDLAVANSGSNNVTVLLGSGTGTFQAAPGSPVSVGNSPSSLAIADFNADNKLDLAVANSGDSTVTVFLGAGNGTFTAIPTLPKTGVGPSSLAVADFNGDGRIDLATVDITDNTASILLQPVAITTSVASLTYVQQGLRSMSAAQTVTLTNNTSAAVTFTTIGVTGPGAADFAAPASGSTCSTTTSLAPGGGTCTINVTFTPQTAGSLDATLSITTNSPATSSLSVQLSGTGYNGGEVSLAPTSFSYPLQRVNTTSSAQVATLINVGAFPVNISSITTSLSEYTIVPPTTSGATACLSLVGSSLAIGAQCVIPVTFTPTAAGTYAGSLNITDDAALSPQVVMLTGVGTNVQFAPGSLSFGSEPIGSTSSVESVTLTDVGTSPLKISGISATSQFSVVSATTCSTAVPLAAGASCKISLTFTPAQQGNIAGTLSITDDDPSSPQQVGLAGVGQDFTVQAFVTTQTVTAGSPANYLLRITPTYGFTGAVSLACTGAPTNATCVSAPTSVTLNGIDYAAPTLQVATSALSLIAPPGGPPTNRRWPLMVGLGLLALAGILLLKAVREKGEATAPLRRWARVASLAAAFLMLMLWASCGGGVTHLPAPANYGTPPGTYTLTVTATAGSLSNSTTVQLTVQQ